MFILSIEFLFYSENSQISIKFWKTDIAGAFAMQHLDLRDPQ